MEAEKYKDNAANFYNWMCKEGVPFSEVAKKLGQFAAVLFYLTKFEEYLKNQGGGGGGENGDHN